MKKSVRTAIENSNLLFYGHWAVLRLNQKLGVLTSLINRQGGNRIHITAELRESFQLTILGLVNLQCSGYLLHGLNLRVTTYTGYGDTHIDSRTDTLIKEIGFEEDLSVSNGNHIRRDIGRNVSCLCLDDRQCGKGTSSFDYILQAVRQVIHFARHFFLTDNLRRAFQQTGMQIEDVTRIRFTSRWTAENQRYLTISYRLLGKVIIHNQRMTAGITEILTDGCTRKWRIVL